MRAVHINEAEAVLEPFWDGGTSDFEDKDKRYCVLDEYDISIAKNTIATLSQGWAFAVFQIDKENENTCDATITMCRDCSIDLGQFNRFIVFGSFPKNTQIKVHGVVNGKKCELISKTEGKGDSTEYFNTVTLGVLTQITLEIYSQGVAIGNIGWFGVANEEKLTEMLNRKTPYTAEWNGFFKNDVKEILPQSELLFSKEDLNDLRKKMMCEPFKTTFEQKRADAVKAMEIVPEEYIGRFLPYYDKRWCRARDINRGNIASIMENLAFVGLVDNNFDMLKMACRHLISVCHCEYWCEAMIGIFPGATWHHRSFTESSFAKAVALVLDWAGALLTPFAKQVAYDALALKALPRIESDFYRVEYIRHMNQGIVFTNGRIYSILALMQRYPRYKMQLENAEKDLIEMINNYVQPDGGTLEGPGYWMFTFRDIMSVFYALARKKGIEFNYYKDLFQKTGNFALGMMSMEDDGTEVLSINDAHPSSHMSCSLASCFYSFTGNQSWKIIYENLLNKKRIDEDVFALICVPNMGTPCENKPTASTAIFETTGQLGCTRIGADLQTHVHYCSGFAYRGHYHQDKGSIIIEANGKTLVPDFGTGYYHESDLIALTNPASHSLLLPVFENGQIAHQHPNGPKGKIISAYADENSVDFYADETDAWEGNSFKLTKRQIVSPFAELIIIADQYCLDNANHASFVLNGSALYTFLNPQLAKMNVANIDLKVAPLNWQWQNPRCNSLLDGERRKVYQLIADAPIEKKGFLITAIWMEKDKEILITKNNCGFLAQHNNRNWQIKIDEEDNRLSVKEIL